MEQQSREIMHTPEGYSNKKPVHTGPVLAVLVILLLLVLGGLYLWGSTLKTEESPSEQPIVNAEPETPRAIADQEILETVSPSDDLGAIEADIESTNLDILDTEFNTVQAELDSAL